MISIIFWKKPASSAVNVHFFRGVQKSFPRTRTTTTRTTNKPFLRPRQRSLAVKNGNIFVLVGIDIGYIIYMFNLRLGLTLPCESNRILIDINSMNYFNNFIVKISHSRTSEQALNDINMPLRKKTIRWIENL